MAAATGAAGRRPCSSQSVEYPDAGTEGVPSESRSCEQQVAPQNQSERTGGRSEEEFGVRVRRTHARRHRQPSDYVHA